jgi:two-component system response regulator AtoC
LSLLSSPTASTVAHLYTYGATRGSLAVRWLAPRRDMAIPDLHLHRVDHPTKRLVGRAPALVVLRAQIRHLAGFDTVGSPHVPMLLLQGETGTGKGLVARVIHDSGPRASGPFVEVNCAAIPDTMLEAELFGFDPGAFTDAKRAKPGLFEAASGGTLLLDEIDALPLALQGRLLTAIESKQVRRLGAVAARAVDVKLIAASNAVLAESVASGRFRADLYHRLAVVVLALPPLRARGEDIVLLAEAMLRHYTAAHGVPAKRLGATARTWLREYLWPGNVRELSHVMERVILLHVGAEVDVETLTSLCQPLVAPARPRARHGQRGWCPARAGEPIPRPSLRVPGRLSTGNSLFQAGHSIP